MNITGTPNLKPFRQYSEYEVINGLFSANVDTLNKGTFVSMLATNSGNTNVSQNANSPATPHLGIAGNFGEAPAYASSKRFEVKWKVRAATHTDVVLGVTLRDVKETNKFGEKYAYRPSYDQFEQMVVLSGEAVPILTRGIISTNGFTGTPVAGSGATVSGGSLVVGVYSTSSVGKWLSSADGDGYALFKVEL